MQRKPKLKREKCKSSKGKGRACGARRERQKERLVEGKEKK